MRNVRVWAITPETMKDLARGAQRLAKKSATQLLRKEVSQCIGRLRALMALERACRLRQGDILVELIDRHDLRPIDIARVTGRRPNHLSQQYHTSKMFPRRSREPDVPYNHYLMAMRMVRKFRALALDPMDVLEEIRSRNLSQHRDVTRLFSQMARAVERARATSSLPLDAAFKLEHAYHASFQSLRGMFDLQSIKILHVDPPYVYGQETYRSRTARSRDCDADDPEAALQLVIDLLRDWQATLAPGGVLLLWQPARLIPKPITEGIERYDWELESLVTWDKGRPQPGAFSSPYSTQCEHLLVLKRAGDVLLNHDNSPRGNILRFAPVSWPRIGSMPSKSQQNCVGISSRSTVSKGNS